MCFYCEHGLPKEVQVVFDKYENIGKATGNELNSSPAHIVWGDNNFQTHHIKWCIGECDANDCDYDRSWCAIVKQSLYELLTIPEEIRIPEGARKEI